MRPDLAKVTTERPRVGRGRAVTKKYGGKVKPQEVDSTYDSEAGGFKSSARRRQDNYKSFSDLLGPLKRVIRSNVGRPWDKVYSEFCQSLDKRSNSGIHIIGHMNDYVDQKCFIEEGKVWSRDNYWGKREIDGFYVHPKTGLLCFKEYKRPKRTPKPITRIQNGEVTYELRKFYNKQGEEHSRWVSGVYKDVPQINPIWGKKEDSDAYEFVGHETVMVREYTNVKSCNKRDLQVIEEFLKAKVKK